MAFISKVRESERIWNQMGQSQKTPIVISDAPNLSRLENGQNNGGEITVPNNKK